jgi:hypothetical protein
LGGGAGTHDDQFVFTARCRDFVNQSTPSALHLATINVMCEMVDVIIWPLVGFKVHVDVTLLGLNGVGVTPLLIDEGNCVINGTMCVTLSVKISVRSPAINDNCCAWFNPSI